MARTPPITDAEWPLMKLLWDLREAGRDWLPAAEIVDPVSRDRGIHHRTVRTLLARLVKKGAVETREDAPTAPGGGYLYRAKLSRDAAVRAESRTFLSRVFDGNAAPALVHLLEESRLSPAELAALRQLLQRKDRP